MQKRILMGSSFVEKELFHVQGVSEKHATTYNLYLDFVFAGTNQSYISN